MQGLANLGCEAACVSSPHKWWRRWALQAWHAQVCCRIAPVDSNNTPTRQLAKEPAQLPAPYMLMGAADANADAACAQAECEAALAAEGARTMALESQLAATHAEVLDLEAALGAQEEDVAILQVW